MTAGVYGTENEQATLLFRAPHIDTELEFFKLEYAGYPLYRIDLSASDYSVRDINEPQGLVAETMRAHFDANGDELMGGQVSYILCGSSVWLRFSTQRSHQFSTGGLLSSCAQVLKAPTQDYSVDGPFGREFKAASVLETIAKTS